MRIVKQRLLEMMPDLVVFLGMCCARSNPLFGKIQPVCLRADGCWSVRIVSDVDDLEQIGDLEVWICPVVLKRTLIDRLLLDGCCRATSRGPRSSSCTYLQATFSVRNA